MTPYALLKVKRHPKLNGLLFNIISVVYFVNSKTILSEENIVIKDGGSSKKILLK